MSLRLLRQLIREIVEAPRFAVGDRVRLKPEYDETYLYDVTDESRAPTYATVIEVHPEDELLEVQIEGGETMQDSGLAEWDFEAVEKVS